MNAVRRAVLAATALVLATGLLEVPAAPASAAPSDPILASARHPILLVVDTSGSMSEDDVAGVQKIEGAKTGLLRLLDRLPQQTVMGLRTYPANTGGCDTGREVIEVKQRAPASMSAEIRTLSASGDTPTAEALQAAGDDLIAKKYEEATIIVVSDGQSTCGDPCPVARSLNASGLSVTIDTIGFSLAPDDPAQQELTCLSDATGGTYTTADSAESLADKLSQFGEAIVQLEAQSASTFYPESQTQLDITATVTNSSSQLVTDLRVDLRFDPAASAGAPAVLAPLRVLGNLEPNATREVTWQVPMTTSKTSGTLRYTARAISAGARPVESERTVELRSGLRLEDAGDIFQDADHVVVLGDSYSAGEGAGNYEKATGDGKNGCHRSANTYAVALFGQARVKNLACSGAIVENHWGSQNDRKENGTPIRSQHQQLKDEVDVEKTDLVLLTMGGNDMGFADIIANCIFGVGCDGLVQCTGKQVWNGAECDKEAVANPMFWEQTMADNVRARLPGYYRDVLRDTGTAPVVVLPYVNVVPLDDRGFNACLGGLPGVSRQELELIRWLQGELNRQIAAAVDEARRTSPAKLHADTRLHYATEVETALLPNHTICDDDTWLVKVPSMAGPGTIKQEVAHPNAAGYQAIAGALLRWSSRANPPPLDDSVTIPDSYLNTGVNAVQGAVDGVKGWVDDRVDDVRSIDLTVPLRTFTAPAGRPITLIGSGYAPGVQVTAGVASTMQTLGTAYADDDGEVELTVTVPEELSGDHTVYAAGFDPDGNYLVRAQDLEVGDPPVWGALAVALLGALLTAGGGLLVRLGLRRRRRVPEPV